MSSRRWVLILSRTLEKADGLLMYTAEAYEPEGVAAIKEWYAETGRKAYITGPLLPAAPKSAASATEQTPSNDLIINFLDETLKASGEKSLVYVSCMRVVATSHILMLLCRSLSGRSSGH